MRAALLDEKEKSEPFALLTADVDDVEVDPGVLERRLGNGGRAEAREQDVHVVGLIPARHNLVQLLQIAVLCASCVRVRVR